MNDTPNWMDEKAAQKIEMDADAEKLHAQLSGEDMDTRRGEGL